MLPTTDKILETIVKQQIVKYFEINKLTAREYETQNAINVKNFKRTVKTV